MPGNEVDDRAHNFFAEEDLLSGHHRSPAADGSWQGLGNNLWAGSQRHVGLSNCNSKGYSLQQSDFQRGQNSHPYQVAHGLNFSRPNLDPELAKSHSQNLLQKPNGCIHGHQSLQTTQNEANFLGVDSECSQYSMTSRGGSSLKNNVAFLSPESSESRNGFDFLGRQQQMSRDNIGVQSLPQHLSGFNDVQLLQQQAMMAKMQELQRQQLETRQHNSLNQNSSIINGTPISPINNWPTEPSMGNKSWLHRAPQPVQGSSNEFRFLPEQAQTQSLMGLIPQVDQSFYGVPVSNTRGTLNQFSHVSLDKHPMQQMAVHSNTPPGHEYTGHTDNITGDGSLSSSRGFHNEMFFGQPSGQGLSRGMHLGNPQLVNSLQMEVSAHDGKAVLPVSSSQITVALDPTEEKILFGDDNIWDSFGDDANDGAVGGSWSALMQSAVAETPTSDMQLQEKWSGSSIHNTETAFAPRSSDININNNTNKSPQGVLGFQGAVPKFPYEHGDRPQVDSTGRTFHHSTVEGRKWLSRGRIQKPPTEGAQIYQNATHSSDVVVNAKRVPGPVPQRDVPSHNSGQIYGELNCCDDVETPSSSGNELSRFHGNESKLRRSGSAGQKIIVPGEMNQSVHVWKAVPGSQSMVGSEQVRTIIGSPQVNREDASLQNRMGRPNSSIARSNEGTSSNTNNLNIWKQGNKPPLNRCSSNDLANMHETDKSEKNENSTDSHNSNISRHTSPGVSENNTWLDGGDTRNLLGGKQKLPGRGSNKNSGPRKFQYHPMGDLKEDVDSFLGRKYATNYQNHGYSGKSEIRQLPKTSSEMEKGNKFSVKQNKIGGDSPSRGTFSGFAPSTSTPFDKDFGIHASDKAAQSSQNVLKPLQNMDRIKENSNSEGSVGTPRQSQSPSSHGFGLQLGFSSQLSVQNHRLSSHNMIQENDNTSLTSSEGQVKRKNVSRTGPSSNGAPQYNMHNLKSTSNSGFPLFRSQLQGQQMIGAIDKHNNHSLQTRIDKKDWPLSSGGTSQLNDAIRSHERASDKEISLTGPPNTWMNTSQQNLMGGQPHYKFPPGTLRADQLNNNAVSPQYFQKASSSGEVHQVKEVLQTSADLAQKPSVSEAKESVLRNQSDASPSNSASTEKEFEAFGHSLKPNDLSHSSYSLLNQMRAMKNTEIDPSNRGLKRFKGAETSVGSQKRQQQSSEQSVPSFSQPADASVDDSSSRLAKTPSQVVLVPGRMDSGNLTCSTSSSSVRVDHSQISLQMAPSWFEQYGTFKNGQMLTSHGAHKYSTLKTIERRSPLGNSFDTSHADSMMERADTAADPNHAGNIWQRSIPTSVMVEKLPSSQLITDNGLVVERQKKRKSPATLPSWHREVIQSSQDLNTSMADVEWAQEANRIIEKVEVEPAYEDAPPNVRSKKRLIFTTQLIQQLFQPPVGATLYADAHSSYEAVACIGARIALVDACSLVPRSSSDSHAPLESINSSTDTHKTNGISGQKISEVTEQFISRSKKLESDFVRLDTRASAADLRVESQELEKLSIINRFARFHGRGQADLAPPGPQRYVIVQPTPRVLTERVQCLSL